MNTNTTLSKLILFISAYQGYMLKFLLYFFIFLVYVSCEEEAEQQKDEAVIAEEKQEYVAPKNEVGVLQLEKEPFKKEILSNGKLVANQKSVLRFKVNGGLEKLLVENGDIVQKGQALASLDPFPYRQSLSSAEISYKKAQLEFEDMLVGRGYDLENRDSIPDNIYEMASLRSGYAEAKNQLENSQADVNATTLRAPFRGKVASIKLKEHEQVNAGTEFITLIDDSVFEVEFHLIESEIDQVKRGEHVQILAFDSNQEYSGEITAINPVVEKNGMVEVKARVRNDGKLLEGMNVKVRIQKNVPDQLVVPKQAVILRQNQEVLFKYQNGKAYWTYVKTTDENSDSYSVMAHPDKSSASLKEGDTVIVRGNLNLAHDTEVVIKNKEV